MVKGHGDLNQALQELLFRCRSGTPSVFQHLMGLEEGGGIEQFDSAQVELRIHTPFWHTEHSCFLAMHVSA